MPDTTTRAKNVTVRVSPAEREYLEAIAYLEGNRNRGTEDDPQDAQFSDWVRGLLLEYADEFCAKHGGKDAVLTRCRGLRRTQLERQLEALDKQI